MIPAGATYHGGGKWGIFITVVVSGSFPYLESRFGAVFFSRVMVFDNDDDTFYKNDLLLENHVRTRVDLVVRFVSPASRPMSLRVPHLFIFATPRE